MTGQSKLRIRTLAMVFGMVVGSNIGDLMLKRGMNEIGSVELSRAGLARALPLTVTNQYIWTGILLLAACTAGYMMVVSWADYSYVMPVGAFGYAMVTLFAVIFLDEHVSIQRWIGVAVVCIGVLLVSQSPPRTTGTIPAAGI
jgi:drug/metabolite transporter (DMT)-like permease